MGVSKKRMEVRDAAPAYDLQATKLAIADEYRQTELGMVPQEWTIERLGDFASFSKGAGISKSDLSPTGKTRCIHYGELFTTYGEVIETIVNGTNHDGTFVRSVPNDVLMPTSDVTPNGLATASCITVRETILGGDILIIRPPADHLNGAYLAYAIKVFRKQVMQLVTGTTVFHLYPRDMAMFACPVPRVEEQRAIATALTDVDALLDALDRLIAKKRDLKQAAMQQLLTGQTRLPGFEGEWKTRTLDRLGQFLKGSGVTRRESQGGHLPCVRYGEIYTFHRDVIRNFYSWITSDAALTATAIKKGDLLFAGSGETKEEIGKCVALAHDVEAYAGGDIVILRTTRLDPSFMGYALNTPEVNAQKAGFGQGDAVVHISASALAQITVKLPEINEQSAIATVLSDMDAEIEALEQRRAKTADLKQAMMQELLTGRTRLVEPRVAA